MVRATSIMVLGTTHLGCNERKGLILNTHANSKPVNLRGDSTTRVLTDNKIAPVEYAFHRSDFNRAFGKITLEVRQCIEDARGRREADLSFDVGTGHCTSDLSGNSDRSS